VNSAALESGHARHRRAIGKSGGVITKVTIAEIAERAGLSKGAVSSALNDRPGVSVETRAKVMAIALELGWNPAQAALSIQESSSSVTDSETRHQQTSGKSGGAIGRVTITDIAERAGLSKGAVSYALNNKPGVSVETRAKVLAIAEQLGWSPSQAARSLSTSRAETVGLVLSRPARMLGIEPFYMEFISGVEGAIAPHGISLMLHVVDRVGDEIDTYKKWWSQGRVDGILLVDLATDDPRIAEVKRIGIPAVSVSSVAAADGLPNVWTDDGRAMQDAVRYLVRLGHKRLARVGGIPSLSHTIARDEAFLQVAREAGLPEPVIMNTDFSGEAGARATRTLLSQPGPPSAIVYDNDIMAVAGLGVAAELGRSVPSELSLLAWDDSPICAITHPPLSAMKRDVPRLGAESAELLMRVIAGEMVSPVEGPLPILSPRGSTSSY
jgi:DNA-binding LacI/PurR family transcriptional regulator